MHPKKKKASKENSYGAKIEKTEEEERKKEIWFINHGGRWELRDKVSEIDEVLSVKDGDYLLLFIITVFIIIIYFTICFTKQVKHV